MYSEGKKGRNEICHLLEEQGIKVSGRSIGNIIHDYKNGKLPLQEPLPSPSQGDSKTDTDTDINTDTTKLSIEESDTDTNIGSMHTIIGSPLCMAPKRGGLTTFEVEKKDGNPLSYFLKEDSESENLEPVVTPTPTPTPTPPSMVPPTPHYRQTPEFESKEPEAEEQQTLQPGRMVTNGWLDTSGFEFDPQVDILDKIMEFKQEIQQEKLSIEQQRQELDEQKQNLAQIKYNIDQRNHNLEIRENKLIEIEPFIPLATQLQAMKIDITSFMPWAETVHEYAVTQNTDLTTAGYNIVKNLRTYKQLEVLQNAIMQAQKQLEILDIFAAQKQQALTTLMNLQNAGITEK